MIQKKNYYRIENQGINYECFKSLPNELQKRLYKRVRDGFEEAYDEAIQYLSSGRLI